MIKYHLPCNKYFFANRNKLFYQLSKNLKELYLKDEFGYFLIVSVIFINYNPKSLILEKRLSLKKY